MTKKTKYSATFTDGTVLTRTSHREYAAAWIAWVGDEKIGDGFARTEELARKAAEGWINYYDWHGRTLRRCKHRALHVAKYNREKVLELGGVEAVKAKSAETLSASRFEIAATTAG